ncbi:hypothetical protein RYX36_024695 [Vicia faba]
MSPTMNSLSHILPFGGISMSLVSLNIETNNLGLVYQSEILSSCSKLRSVLVQCDSEIQLKHEFRRFLDDLYGAGLTELGTSHASQVSDLSLRSVLIGIGSCHIVIDTLEKSLSQRLATNCSNYFFPEDNYPSWLVYRGEGPSVKFQVPEDTNSVMKGITLCVLHSSRPENLTCECFTSVLIINYTKFTFHIYKGDTVISFNDEDWLSVKSNLGVGDNVEIFVTIGHELIVKETAVYLIYEMEVDPTIQVEAQPSPDVKTEPSLFVKNEPLPKTKRISFIRFAKRVRKCLCLNEN